MAERDDWLQALEAILCRLDRIIALLSRVPSNQPADINQFRVGPVAQGEQIVGRNPRRQILIIAGAVNGARIWTRPPVGGEAGWSLGNSGVPLVLTRGDYCDLVGEAYYNPNAGATTYDVVEVYGGCGQVPDEIGSEPISLPLTRLYDLRAHS